MVLQGLPDANAQQAARARLATVGAEPAAIFGHNLADAAHVHSLMEETLALGPLDILANNAGIQYTAPMTD